MDEAFSVAAHKLAFSVYSNDPNVARLAGSTHSVYMVFPNTDDAIEFGIPNDEPTKEVLVKFTPDQTELLIVAARAPLNAAPGVYYWSFTFWSSRDTRVLFIDRPGGKIDHTGIAINADHSKIYFLTNRPYIEEG